MSDMKYWLILGPGRLNPDLPEVFSWVASNPEEIKEMFETALRVAYRRAATGKSGRRLIVLVDASALDKTTWPLAEELIKQGRHGGVIVSLASRAPGKSNLVSLPVGG